MFRAWSLLHLPHLLLLSSLLRRSVGRVWVAGVIVAPRALGGVELLFLTEGAAVSAAPSLVTGLLNILPCRFEHDPNPLESCGLSSVVYTPVNECFLQEGRS